MPQAKAVITDYIGTLTSARRYTIEASTEKLYGALADVGFKTEKTRFLKAYAEAHEKYRFIRYSELREVTNAIWVSEALRSIGFDVTAENSGVKAALNVFFEDFVESLELRPYAEKLLKKAAATCKLGLISNFTYAPVVHASLRKLGISDYFNTIVVSEANGWRKPHQKIFKQALLNLQTKPEDSVYIGDSPKEDIKGAVEAGMKAIFVVSQFYSLSDLIASGEKPDLAVKDLQEICKNFSKIVKCRHELNV